MSTFDGFIREIPGIRVDLFSSDPTNLYFLSHCHLDHMRGLENRAFNSPIFCSEISARIIIRIRNCKYLHLRESIRPLPMREPVHLETLEGERLTVTVFPANHCPGSCMFLFESKAGRVLYTGDSRLDETLLNEIRSSDGIFTNSFGRARRIKSLYMDTTFCDAKVANFPSKDESAVTLLNAISKYPPQAYFSLNVLSLGYEHIIISIARKFKTKVHTSSEQYGIYAAYASINSVYLCDEDMTQFVISDDDSEKYQFHFRCKCWQDIPMIEIKATAAAFCDMSSTNGNICIQSPSSVHLFFATHSSFNELRSLVEFIQPSNIYPCVLEPRSMFLNCQVLHAFDDLLIKNRNLPSNNERQGSRLLIKTKSMAETILQEILSESGLNQSDDVTVEQNILTQSTEIGDVLDLTQNDNMDESGGLLKELSSGLVTNNIGCELNISQLYLPAGMPPNQKTGKCMGGKKALVEIIDLTSDTDKELDELEEFKGKKLQKTISKNDSSASEWIVGLKRGSSNCTRVISEADFKAYSENLLQGGNLNLNCTYPFKK